MSKRRPATKLQWHYTANATCSRIRKNSFEVSHKDIVDRAGFAGNGRVWRSLGE